MRGVFQLKLIENENLNKFYGIAFNQQNELIVMWLLCNRGSLEDILFNEDMKLGYNFQVSFAKDVVKVIDLLGIPKSENCIFRASPSSTRPPYPLTAFCASRTAL